MWIYTVLLVLVFCSWVHSEVTIPEYKLRDHCNGGFLSAKVGKIKLDREEFPSDYGGECTMFISKPAEDSQLMFYFTEFDLSSYCDEANLTVEQWGDYMQWKSPVPGLPVSMCGENRTLIQTNQNFTTSLELRLTFRFSEYGRRNPGTFSIYYFQFHTSDCDDDDEHECSDGHCVKEELHCSDKIRVCPVDDLTCDDISVLQSIVDQIVEILKSVGWVIFFMIVIFIVMRFLKMNKERIRGLIQRLMNGGRKPREQEEDNVSRSLQMNDVTVEMSDTNDDNHRRNSLRDVTSLHTLQQPERPMPTQFQADQPTNPGPTAPPPSYEEVMAPSYDEVMSNEHKYKTSALN